MRRSLADNIEGERIPGSACVLLGILDSRLLHTWATNAKELGIIRSAGHHDNRSATWRKW